MVEERRQHSRLVPTSPMFVSLDHSKSGLLLDVGEGGMAVASLLARNLDDVISVAFELPDGRGSIQAEAEIAWIRDAGHLTGARFLHVDDHSLRQLCDWISATPKTAPVTSEGQVESGPEQLSLIAEKECAAPETEEANQVTTEFPAEAVSEEEVALVHEDVLEDHGEMPEIVENAGGVQCAGRHCDEWGDAESAVLQDACSEDAPAQEIPSHYSLDPFNSIQGSVISDAPES